MAKRKPISASVRWQIFARDNFTCRYCGAQAGQTGVNLQIEHIISVVDGGSNEIDNLLTSCQRCNNGKGARSLASMPDAPAIEERMRDRAESIARQAESIRAAIDGEKQLFQQAVNLKCEAYRVDSVVMATNEERIIINLCKEFGSETVLDWYRAAYSRDVQEKRAVKYVCGIARNTRESLERGGSNA